MVIPKPVFGGNHGKLKGEWASDRGKDAIILRPKIVFVKFSAGALVQVQISVRKVGLFESGQTVNI